MGKSVSKNREEYNKAGIKCRGYVEMYSFKSGSKKRRYFILQKTNLGYSKSKEISVK